MKKLVSTSLLLALVVAVLVVLGGIPASTGWKGSRAAGLSESSYPLASAGALTEEGHVLIADDTPIPVPLIPQTFEI